MNNTEIPYDVMKQRGLLKEKYYYFHIISRITSIPLAIVANKFNISPNLVTISGMLLVIPAMFCHFINQYFAAIFIFHLFFVFDCLDGVLARATQTTSSAGAYLDDLAHYIFHSGYFISFAFAKVMSGELMAAFSAIIFIISNLIFRAHHDLVFKVNQKASSSSAAIQSVPSVHYEIILGTFNFPNVVIYLTIGVIIPIFLKYYLLYAAVSNTLYLIYVIKKQIGKGF